MMSNELTAVLEEIRQMQTSYKSALKSRGEFRAKAIEYNNTARIYDNSAKEIEIKLDNLQIKLRDTIIADDKKYGIKGPTVEAPAEPVQEMIGREG